MEYLTAKSTIEETFNEINELANEKDIKAVKEEAVNNFLDKISVFRSSIEAQTSRVIHINSNLEKLSWFHEIDDECLELIKQLLDKTNSVHKKLINSYVKMSWVISKGIATEVMRNYKIALDDLKEYNEDLKDLYFNLPNDIEYTNRIQTLSK